PGGIPREEIESCLGVEVPRAVVTEPKSGALLAPGTLASHYAPKKRLYLLPKRVSELSAEDLAGIPLSGTAPLGLLIQSGEAEPTARRLESLIQRTVIAVSLSPKGNLAEIARNLFSSLRKLDASAAELLLAEPCPGTNGLSYAISDRLTRAATT